MQIFSKLISYHVLLQSLFSTCLYHITFLPRGLGTSQAHCLEFSSPSVARLSPSSYQGSVLAVTSEVARRYIYYPVYLVPYSS